MTHQQFLHDTDNLLLAHHRQLSTTPDSLCPMKSILIEFEEEKMNIELSLFKYVFLNISILIRSASVLGSYQHFQLNQSRNREKKSRNNFFTK